MKRSETPSIFTLEIAGVPAVAFEAKDLRDAEELITLDWFLNDMESLRSNGTVLGDATGLTRTRHATEEEIAQFRKQAPCVPKRPRGALLEYLAPLALSSK